ARRDTVVRVLAPFPKERGDLRIVADKRGPHGPEHQQREGQAIADALCAHLPFSTVAWVVTSLVARATSVRIPPARPARPAPKAEAKNTDGRASRDGGGR
ncbi:MAG TPA: hypothetical protein VEA38_08520, partial [Terriglobales bacterium]|nr:hypothetical protein [Terriglobales bacterium]